MKTTTLVLLFSAGVALLSSCAKEKHFVRFSNSFKETVSSLKAGSANIGSVAAGQSSNYQTVNGGNFQVSGSTSSGQQLTGSASVTGKGEHKWTIVLNTAGEVSINEDK